MTLRGFRFREVWLVRLSSFGGKSMLDFNVFNLGKVFPFEAEIWGNFSAVDFMEFL